MKTSSSVRSHFDEIAPRYDSFKRRSSYYYGSLKKQLHEIVEPQKRVLEIGCGTGEILEAVRPQEGLGIDISEQMIELATKKHSQRPELTFVSGEAEDVRVQGTKRFDYILLVDVVEHLESVAKTVRQIGRLSSPMTQIVVSMANPGWEPILMVLEKLHLKMPEGPHYRPSSKTIISEFARNGLTLQTRKKYLHIPFYLPFVSDPLNKLLSGTPGVRALGLIEIMVFKLELRDQRLNEQS